jgi:hypothetical protein
MLHRNFHAIPYISLQIYVFFAQKTSVFPNGKSPFFGHTSGDGWEQNNDNRTGKQHAS